MKLRWTIGLVGLLIGAISLLNEGISAFTISACGAHGFLTWRSTEGLFGWHSEDFRSDSGS